MPNSLDQWTYAIKRHWLLSITAFALILATTVLVILFAPRAYRSEAKLLLRIGRESVTVDPTASTVGETISLHHTRENEIQSAIGVMQSREILDRVVDQVGVDVVLSGKPESKQEAPSKSMLPSWIKDTVDELRGKLAKIDPVPSREQALERLAGDLGIGAASESSVVSVSYKTDSAEVARDVVDAWVVSYITQHSKVNRTPGSYAFFEEQDAVLKAQLEAARENLRATKNESRLVTIDGQQKLLEAQLSKVRDGQIDTESEIAAIGSRVKSYDVMLTNFDETITSEVTGKANEGRDAMRTALFELEVLEKDLRSKYRPGHPKLVAIEGQLEDAARIVSGQSDDRKEVTRTINPAYQQVVEYKMLDEATLSGLTEKQKSLEAKQRSLELEIVGLNGDEQRIGAASNELAILEERYALHAKKLEQARLDDVLASQRITSVNVVQPASLEQKPVKPNKGLCAIAGLFAACAAAISLPVLVEANAARRQTARSKRGTHREWQFDQREAEADIDDRPETGSSANFPPATVASVGNGDLQSG